MKEKEIAEMLNSINQRLDRLESQQNPRGQGPVQRPIDPKDFANGPSNFDDNAPHTIINPKLMPENYIGYVGKYASENGKIGATFGCDLCNLKSVLRQDTFEMCNVLTAFASEERINILKSLLRSPKTAKELMEGLGFQTTGKLYHHLSFLEKIGALRKEENSYRVVGKYISCILLIFAAVDKILRNEKPVE